MAKTSPPCVPATRPPYLSSKGFTLVEVLVAIIILVLGVLGAAAMTTTALRNNHHASSRSIAVGLAYELGEMMRSNPALSPASGTNLLTSVYLANTPAQRTACYAASGCTLTQQAENELWEFGQRVANRLPGGQYAICRDASSIADGTPAAPQCDGLATSPVVIKIWWTVRRADGVVDTTSGTTGVSVVLRPV